MQIQLTARFQKNLLTRKEDRMTDENKKTPLEILESRGWKLKPEGPTGKEADYRWYLYAPFDIQTMEDGGPEIQGQHVYNSQEAALNGGKRWIEAAWSAFGHQDDLPCIEPMISHSIDSDGYIWTVYGAKSASNKTFLFKYPAMQDYWKIMLALHEVYCTHGLLDEIEGLGDTLAKDVRDPLFERMEKMRDEALDKHHRLQRRYRELESEYFSFQAARGDEDNIDELKEVIKQTRSDKTGLEIKNRELTRQLVDINEDLQIAKETLDVERNKVRTRYEALQAEYKALEDKYVKLRDELKAANQGIAKLKSDEEVYHKLIRDSEARCGKQHFKTSQKAAEVRDLMAENEELKLAVQPLADDEKEVVKKLKAELDKRKALIEKQNEQYMLLQYEYQDASDVWVADEKELKHEVARLKKENEELGSELTQRGETLVKLNNLRFQEVEERDKKIKHQKESMANGSEAREELHRCNDILGKKNKVLEDEIEFLRDEINMLKIPKKLEKINASLVRENDDLQKEVGEAKAEIARLRELVNNLQREADEEALAVSKSDGETIHKLKNENADIYVQLKKAEDQANANFSEIVRLRKVREDMRGRMWALRSENEMLEDKIAGIFKSNPQPTPSDAPEECKAPE